MIVVGDDVARRPQAVAVERRADLAAVGEGDRRRPVPRLHQRRVIFVEGAPLRVHQRVGPRLRDQHHHRMRQRIAAADDEQFERVVDAGRVGLARPDQRHHLGEIGAEQFRRHRLPPRRHPVDVAAHRVDLAVVADEPVRVREPPGREGVGRKALMHQRQRRHGQRVAQIVVEALDLRRQQQALVDERCGSRRTACRDRRSAGMPCSSASAATLFSTCLRIVRILRSNCVLVARCRGWPRRSPGDIRHRLDDRCRRARSYRSPTSRQPISVCPSARMKCSKCSIATARARFVHRQKAHRDRIAAGRRQVEAALLGPIAQQPVRHLDHAAGAVADQRVGSDRAAMVEIDQDLQPAADDIVRFSALDVRDKADAAGVVLVARIIEAFFASRCHPQCSFRRWRRVYSRAVLPLRRTQAAIRRFASMHDTSGERESGLRGAPAILCRR